MQENNPGFEVRVDIEGDLSEEQDHELREVILIAAATAGAEWIRTQYQRPVLGPTAETVDVTTLE